MAPHLTPAQIRKFTHHQCSPAELQEMSRHVPDCADCRQKLGYPARIESGVSFLKSWLATTDEPPVEHLAADQLLAYIGNKLDAIERELVENHAENCPSCDLQLKELAAFAARQNHPRPNLPPPPALGLWAWLQTLWQVPALPVFRWQAGLAGLLLVTGACAWLYWFQATPNRMEPLARQPELLVQQKQPERPSVSQVEPTNESSVAPVTPPRSLPNQKPASTATRLPSNGKTLLPRQFRAAFFQPGTLLGKTPQELEVKIVGPWTTFVAETQPILRWETGNQGGTTVVTIFDAQYNQIAQSPPLSETSWQVPFELAPGQFYSWEVSTTVNGKTVVAPLPPSPEARFKVLSRMERKALEGQLEKAGNEPVQRGLALVQAGCVEAAEREFALVSPHHPQAAAVRKLVRTLRQNQ
ncbi:MAG: zf-HC2 domain-containing protein [Blastocatellia bacterium]|nr:zf-HC2 domain-containing protein [Blastocatellia bacterium]